MSHKKPEPIVHGKQPKICPVCGKPSYSAAGVHPQCSVKLADQQRTEARKAEMQSEAQSKPGSTKKKNNLSRWQKTCPKCKTALHVRKKICDCGHDFSESAST